jgi:dihydrolipoamide dehydrogenase
MADNSFDVVVIGSGPGGYVTAIRAAQLGFKTAIVEKAYLGGICNNWGCIPTKALLRSAEIYHYMTHAKDYGLSADNVSFDPKAVIARSRAVVRLNGGVEFLMKKNKISIIWGEATLDAPGKFTVKKSAAEAPKGSLGEALTPPSTSSSPPVRVRACCRVLSRTRNWSGPISRR